jgi:hypothetical protein
MYGFDTTRSKLAREIELDAQALLSTMQKRFPSVRLPIQCAFENDGGYGLISGAWMSCTSIARPSLQSS